MTYPQQLAEYVLRRAGEIPLQPDPRLSTLRPGWLADDQQWRDQLQAMEDDDWRWIEKQWDMAGGKAPAVDTSWVTTEKIGGPGIWPLVGLMLVVSVVFALIVEWVR